MESLMKQILFVCTGNTCRSPMAEGLFRKMVASTSTIGIASAGVSAAKGQRPSDHAIRVLAEDEGVDISGQRSQPVTKKLVDEASWIFAMTRDHKEMLELIFPSAQGKVHLLREWEAPGQDIPDPVGRGRENYTNCKNTIKSSLEKILTVIEKSPTMLKSHIESSESIPHIEAIDPEIAAAIFAEAHRQEEHIELIASENYTSRAVMEAQGSCLTNKYAEGYPGKRWYGGCEHVDVVETLAISRAKQLFGADHANVQPHSGSQANTAVYFSVLTPGDKILTMDLAHGGHLTHGHKANFSGKLYEVVHYGVSADSGQIDYDALAQTASEVKPKMITAGASAYPRVIDFARMREIADSVGAYLFVDMAHIAGLVAGGQHPSPVAHADFVTSTTHKSLRGPRGGIILCKEQYAKKIDSLVFPGVQGGPLMHVIAAKAICFLECLQPEFRDYARQVVTNAKALAASLTRHGYTITSGGTDNHVMLVDLRPHGITGVEAQIALDHAAITVNKNAVPFDTEPIFKTGGVRIGTPAMTTRGMKEEEMMEIADLIHAALEVRNDAGALAGIRERVTAFTAKFPLPA